MASPRALLCLAALLTLFACRLAVAADLPTAPAATPSAEDLDLAKAHYHTGELNFTAGKFTDAAHEFEESYRLSGRPELLYNMGACYDKIGDMRGALIAYRTFMRTVQQSPDRPFVEKRQAELEKLIAHIDIKSSVNGSSVMLDGQRLGSTPLVESVVEVNPGEHAVDISAEGYATLHQKVNVSRSETQRVDAKMVSLVKVIHVPDHYVPVYKRWYLWTAVGIVVVAGVVTGAVLGARKAEEINGPHLQLPETK